MATMTKCFYYRLYKTALVAKENKFDNFGTTLTVSPHKSTLVINKVGKEIEEEVKISYLEEVLAYAQNF